MYGCMTCQYSGSILQCTSCQYGLYLLSNATSNGNFGSWWSYCVPDCRLAHASYVNDPISGKCQCNFLLLTTLGCGRHCTSCNLKNGCEGCPPANANYAYTTAPSVPSGYSSPTYSNFGFCQGKILIINQNLECANSKRCQSCSSSNANTCTSCRWQFNSPYTPYSNCGMPLDP